MESQLLADTQVWISRVDQALRHQSKRQDATEAKQEAADKRLRDIEAWAARKGYSVSEPVDGTAVEEDVT
jgi:hypothetical protein